MNEQKFCQGCGQQPGCRQIFEQLTSRKGPSVTAEVLAAFLVPILTFIGTLLFSTHILGNIIDTKPLLTVFSFILALAGTSAAITILNLLCNKYDRIR